MGLKQTSICIRKGKLGLCKLIKQIQVIKKKRYFYKQRDAKVKSYKMNKYFKQKIRRSRRNPNFVN